jgi:hypothetical protein
VLQALDVHFVSVRAWIGEHGQALPLAMVGISLCPALHAGLQGILFFLRILVFEEVGLQLFLHLMQLQQQQLALVVGTAPGLSHLVQLALHLGLFGGRLLPLPLRLCHAASSCACASARSASCESACSRSAPCRAFKHASRSSAVWRRESGPQVPYAPAPVQQQPGAALRLGPASHVCGCLGSRHHRLEFALQRRRPGVCPRRPPGQRAHQGRHRLCGGHVRGQAHLDVAWPRQPGSGGPAGASREGIQTQQSWWRR